ncbi:MAG: SGNH/GDSL hydrolase family protein [bacterium]
MRNRTSSKVGLAAALIVSAGLAFSGCAVDQPSAPEVTTGTIDFTTMSVIGNSLSAGVVNGGLGGFTQANSFPALIAGQVETAFIQPAITDPGIPTKKQLVITAQGPAIVDRSGEGIPTNTGYAGIYNNLAVPGATSVDVMSDDGSSAGTISQVILRGQGTQVELAVASSPSIVFVWAGSNDVLGGALSGVVADGVTTVPIAATTASLTGLFTTLESQTTAEIVAANVPDVTTIPYVTYLSRGYTSPLTDDAGTQTVFPVITTGTGTERQATEDDYILLPAATAFAMDPTLGQPTNPVPNELVLDEAEITDLQSRVDAINSVIETQASSAGAILVDTHALMTEAAASPMTITEGGVDYEINSLFVSDGGMTFSLDGVHPTTAGYVMVANYFIDVLNQAPGAAIPHVSYSRTVFPRVAAEGKVALEKMPDFTGLQEHLMEIYGIRR